MYDKGQEKRIREGDEGTLRREGDYYYYHYITVTVVEEQAHVILFNFAAGQTKLIDLNTTLVENENITIYLSNS